MRSDASTSLRVASHDHEPPSEEYAARSGGIFRDQLIHDFDMVRWVSGSEVDWVYTAGVIHTLDFLASLGDVDTCVLTLSLAGGELVAMTGSREDGRGEDVRIEAIGSADSASAGFNARTPLLLLDPLGVSAGHEPYGGAFDRFAAAYAAEIAHFLDLARGEADNPCPPREALATLLVAVAAERSLASGTRVQRAARRRAAQPRRRGPTIRREHRDTLRAPSGGGGGGMMERTRGAWNAPGTIAAMGAGRNSVDRFELITMGRVGVDLYPQQIDVPLERVTTFTRSLGGSPTNVAVAAARLGVRAAVITKVGAEQFGVYVREALERFGVDRALRRRPSDASHADRVLRDPPAR